MAYTTLGFHSILIVLVVCAHRSHLRPGRNFLTICFQIGNGDGLYRAACLHVFELPHLHVYMTDGQDIPSFYKRKRPNADKACLACRRRKVRVSMPPVYL